MAEDDDAQQLHHTYAFLKAGSANRYLKYAEKWGGFYIGFEGFPLELLARTYDDAAGIHPRLEDQPEKNYFKLLQKIYRVSTDPWRSKVRYVLWDRENCWLEIWQATDQLRSFPREHMSRLFDGCALEANLSNSPEWRNQVKEIERINPGADPFDFVCGPSGCRFLPARRICDPIASETLYAPIDTLSVLWQLNQRTFAFMTNINPPAVPWPEGIFEGVTVFDGPDGCVRESGYGRFVREYLDCLVDPDLKNSLTSLTYDQRMLLVCATVNPLLVETAAMLFALDIGMVIDSGRGKGRQGIDVIAACGRQQSPSEVLEKLSKLGFFVSTEAAEHFHQARILAFQCKGYDGSGPLATTRVVEFRPFGSEREQRGISLLQVLRLARDPQSTGFRHLNSWLDRMCAAVVPGEARHWQ